MLPKLQQNWRTALFDGRAADAGLSLDPAYEARFIIYQRNVMASLTEVLADTFPVTQALLSEDTFAGLARLYVRQTPPTAPVLAYYGDTFPAFVAQHDLGRQLPYLAGVARLEWARVAVFFAPSAPARSLTDFANALERSTALHLQPAVQLWRDNYDGFAIWRAHQTMPVDLSAVDLAPGDYAALIYRSDDAVVVAPLAPALHGVLQGIMETGDYAAATAALDDEAATLLGAHLAEWFALGLFRTGDENE